MVEPVEDRTVAWEVFEPLRRFAEERGLSERELTAGWSAPPEPGRPLRWDDLVLALERFAAALDDPADLFEYGRRTVRVPEIQRLARAVALFVSPQTFLVRGGPLIMRRTFGHLETRAWREGDEVLIEHVVPPPHRPCRVFFAFHAGVVAEATRVIGLPPQQVVTAIRDERTVVYRCFPPPSRTLGRRTRQWARILLNADAAVGLLERDQRALRATNRELARLVRERDEALAEQSRALETRERLLQTLGHELRTPLNGLTHAAAALARGESEPWVVRTVLAASGRLSGVVESVIFYVKLSGEEAEPHPRPVRTEGLLERVVESLDGEASLLGVPLVPTSQVASPWSVVDHDLLLKAMVALARNAVEHSPEVSPVELELRHVEGRLRFEARDRGPGIQPADRARAFEPFVQLGGHAARAKGGIGFGLPLARAVAECMGGQVELRPRAGGGLVAAIEVPAEAHAPPERRVGARRVLVVDDDRLNRAVLGRLLRRMGCTIQEAEDGAQALERLEQGTFDLVLMDCEMPVLDGWEATRRLRERGVEAPVVAATAYASDADRERCRAAGMDDFLAKPIDRALLASTLERWLGAPPP
mgnify:FL=1